MPENRVVMCSAQASGAPFKAPARRGKPAMPRLRSVVGGLVASLLPTAARAETCEPTAIEADASLPTPWRRQLELLGERTHHAGSPWACHGGRVRLVPVPGSTARRLVVTDPDGREKAQDIESPDDVVPFGEALLARPLDAETDVTAPAPAAEEPKAAKKEAGPTPPPPAATAAPSPPSAATEDHRVVGDEDRFALGLSVGPRLVFPLNDLALTARVHALGSVGALVVGGWGRVDGPSWSLDDQATEVSTFAIGPALGVRIPLGGPQLRFTLEPSLAVVVDQSGGGADPEADARIGVGADAVFPLTKLLRFTAGIDGEIAPARLDEGNGRRGDGGRDDDGDGRGANDPDMPAGSIGLRIGLELTP